MSGFIYFLCVTDFRQNIVLRLAQNEFFSDSVYSKKLDDSLKNCVRLLLPQMLFSASLTGKQTFTFHFR
jgi:hypothetical protein